MTLKKVRICVLKNINKILIGGIIDLLIFLPLILLAFSFRKTRKQNTKNDKLKSLIQSLTGQKVFEEKEKDELIKKRKFSFPWYFKIILYKICVLVMLGTIFFTILKGYFFRKFSFNFS
jgi:ABC-type glycerol-3-phosphate transport system permease component